MRRPKLKDMIDVLDEDQGISVHAYTQAEMLALIERLKRIHETMLKRRCKILPDCKD